MNRCNECTNPIFSWETSCPVCGNTLTPENREYNIPLGGGIFTPSYPTKSTSGAWAESYWGTSATPWQRVEKTFDRILITEFKVLFLLSALLMAGGVSLLFFVETILTGILLLAGVLIVASTRSWIELRESRRLLSRAGRLKDSFPYDDRCRLFAESCGDPAISDSGLPPSAAGISKIAAYILLDNFRLCFGLLPLIYFVLFVIRPDLRWPHKLMYQILVALLIFVIAVFYYAGIEKVKSINGVADYKYILIRNYLFRLFRPHIKNVLLNGERIMDLIPTSLASQNPILLVVTDKACLMIDPVKCLKGKPVRNDFLLHDSGNKIEMIIGKRSLFSKLVWFSIGSDGAAFIRCNTENSLTFRRTQQRLAHYFSQCG